MTARLRIMHLVLGLNPGGTERLVIEMCKRMRQDVDLEVCCLDGKGAWARQLEELGIPVTSLGRRPGFRPSLAGRIARLAKRHGIDVVHCHHYTPFVYGALAARLCPGLRLVFTEHGRASDRPPSSKRRLANLVLARLPGDHFAVSEDLRSFMLAEGFRAHRLRVIHNGVEPVGSLQPSERESLRRGLGVGVTAFVVGTVARLDPVKDLGTLISAFSSFAEKCPAAVLAVVGDGPARESLEALAEDSPVSSRIRFAGFRDDARQLVAAFDVYVNSSITEGISVTILEAMSAQVPVIATNVGGTPEILVDGESGILVPLGDIQAVARALSQLASEAELRARFARNGVQRVAAKFGLQHMVAQYLAAYRGEVIVSQPNWK